MRISSQNAYWLEVAGLSLISVAFFRFGLLLLLFLVPLQILWVRRGERAGLTGSLIFLGALAVLKGIDYLRVRELLTGGAGASVGMLFIDVALPIGFLIGLYALNSARAIVPVGQSGERRLLTDTERMIIALAAASVVYVSVILYVYLNGAVDELISAQVALMQSLLSDASAGAEEIEALTALVVRVFLSGFLVAHLVVLLVNWWFGTRIAFRGPTRIPSDSGVAARLVQMRLNAFRLPTQLIWLLVGAWGGVLLSMVVELDWFAYVLWNLALVALCLYGVQGLALLWHLLQRRGLPRGARIGVALALLVVLLIPGLNLVVLIGLPGFGASEIWVNYHRFEGSVDEQ